jgi:hypothetical protein
MSMMTSLRPCYQGSPDRVKKPLLRSLLRFGRAEYLQVFHALRLGHPEPMLDIAGDLVGFTGTQNSGSDLFDRQPVLLAENQRINIPVNLSL